MKDIKNKYAITMTQNNNPIIFQSIQTRKFKLGIAIKNNR